MSVEVRNLQTGQTYAVGDDGAIFGREGGGAAIQVADRSVSKKHARVFTDGTEWFLEDMGSVNGTVVDGNKIGGAIPLRSGLVFSLSKFKFEIVRVPAPYNSTPDVETRTSMRKNSNANGNQDLPSELRKDPIPRKRQRDLAPPRAAQEQADDDDYNQPPPVNRNNNLPLAPDNDFPSQVPRGRGDEQRYDDEAAPVLGIDQYEELSPAEAVTTGIGYVLKNAPLLAFNPIGTVRNHIERPPLPALEKVPLAALLAPALAVTVTIQSGAGALAALILGGGGVFGVILAPVIGVIAGVIGALISGFLTHPVLSFIIDKLGGSSDARTRTAHVGIGMVANVVLLVPNVLAVLLTAIVGKLATVSAVFSLLLIIPALIALVATPLPIYIQWQFFKSYGVAKWFQTLLLVVMVLALLGGLYSSVMAIVGAVKGMSSGTTVSVVDGVAPPVDGVTPPVDGVTPPVTPPDPDDAPSGSDKKPPTTDPKPATPTTTTTPPTTPPPTVTTPTTTQPTTTPLPVTTTTTTRPPPATAPPTTKVTIDVEYGTFERKRAEIEAVLERDPTLVVRDLRVAKLYETFLTRADEAENLVFQRFNGRKRPSALNPLYEKAKKAEVYDKTKIDVNQLHRALFGGN